jgi:hypothetical protein
MVLDWWPQTINSLKTPKKLLKLNNFPYQTIEDRNGFDGADFHLMVSLPRQLIEDPNYLKNNGKLDFLEIPEGDAMVIRSPFYSARLKLSRAAFHIISLESHIKKLKTDSDFLKFVVNLILPVPNLG